LSNKFNYMLAYLRKNYQKILLTTLLTLFYYSFLIPVALIGRLINPSSVSLFDPIKRRGWKDNIVKSEEKALYGRQY
jgi:hypothetical protein